MRESGVVWYCLNSKIILTHEQCIQYHSRPKVMAVLWLLLFTVKHSRLYKTEPQ